MDRNNFSTPALCLEISIWLVCAFVLEAGEGKAQHILNVTFFFKLGRLQDGDVTHLFVTTLDFQLYEEDK